MNKFKKIWNNNDILGKYYIVVVIVFSVLLIGILTTLAIIC